MIAKSWEHFPHQADIGVRGIGATKAEAFEQAAVALTSVVADAQTVQPLDALEIQCEAADDELLLVDWLSQIVYEMDSRRMLFSRFDVYVGNKRLKARIWGEPVDPGRHKPAVEVKGVTYHELAVRHKLRGGWIAQCVVDV